MRVHEVMTRDVECTRPDATLRDAAVRMRDLDVGTLPVCENDRLVGILSDRDIVVRAVAGGQAPTATVREAMTPRIVTCFEDDDVAEAARLMKENQIRRVAVLDRGKKLVGIVSLGDLAVETGDDRLSGEALERISEPAEPRR